MNIEKINDTQLKVFCSAEELREKGLTIDDLSYGAEETQKIIRSALLMASVDHAFSTKDSNLMVEITPLPKDDLEILITKVDYPDEFDTRYAEFLQAAPESDASQEEEGISDFRDDGDGKENRPSAREAEASARSEDYDYKDDLSDAAKDPSAENESEDYLPVNDPEEEENESADRNEDPFPGMGDFQEMLKAFQGEEFPQGFTFAPLDPSQLAKLPGFDPSMLQNGQILGGTIIDARTSDGRVLSPQEISGLLKGLVSGLENQAAQQTQVEEDEDASKHDPTDPAESGSDRTDSVVPAKKSLIRMFAFDTLDDCIQACRAIADFFHGDSKLFRAPKKDDQRSSSQFGAYVLCITNDRISGREFSMAYNHLFEYNGRRISPKIAFSHIEEHYEPFIASDAVQILKDL